MYRPLSPRKLQRLQERCWATFERAVADTLLQAYQQPHRKYHTLSHIEELLRGFDAQAWRHPRAVEWAVWFHDVVYETTADAYANNETASAGWVLQLLVPGADQDMPAWERDCDLARRLVLATQSHRATAWEFAPDELEDAQRFLDLDLAVLAQPWSQVLAFDAAIRQEFSQYTEEQFAQGRSQALRSLEAGTVFQGPKATELEPLAQENLRKLTVQWEARLSARS